MELGVEEYDSVLIASGYIKDNQTQKAIRYRFGGHDEWIYVSVTGRTPSFVIHPKYLQLFSELNELPGIVANRDGNEPFKHSTNIGKFPKRQHTGKNRISHGLEFRADSKKSIYGFISVLSGTNPKRSEDEDIVSAESDMKDLGATEREDIVKARRGQGKFRTSLDKRYGRCQLTGCETREALRASHIKPWIRSSNYERLDPANGLLLRADVDAIFDCGLISFDEEGGIVLSGRFDRARLSEFGLTIDASIDNLSIETRKYMEYHREYILNCVAV